jgi:single-strand DNA-binding protein
MPGLNQATIIGRVGKDPEVKSFDWGKVANFSIATSEKWKDKQSGEMKERTQWHNIVVKNDRLVDLADKYIKKGDNVGVVGAIETRKWEKDGKDHYTTEIVLGMFNGQIILLGGGGSSNRDDGERSTAKPQTQAQSARDLDDDIPF